MLMGIGTLQMPPQTEYQYISKMEASTTCTMYPNIYLFLDESLGQEVVQAECNADISHVADASL